MPWSMLQLSGKYLHDVLFFSPNTTSIDGIDLRFKYIEYITKIKVDYFFKRLKKPSSSCCYEAPRAEIHKFGLESEYDFSQRHKPTNGYRAIIHHRISRAWEKCEKTVRTSKNISDNYDSQTLRTGWR